MGWPQSSKNRKRKKGSQKGRSISHPPVSVLMQKVPDVPWKDDGDVQVLIDALTPMGYRDIKPSDVVLFLYVEQHMLEHFGRSPRDLPDSTRAEELVAKIAEVRQMDIVWGIMVRRFNLQGSEAHEPCNDSLWDQLCKFGLRHSGLPSIQTVRFDHSSPRHYFWMFKKATYLAGR